jgi:hypothetical protein
MACSKFFSFAEVVQGRNATVRVTEDGFLFAVELNMVVSGKDRNNAGRDLRNLSNEEFSHQKFRERRLPGKGNCHTKLVSFENAIELIMVLPGKQAKHIRKQLANIIVRYLDGDTSMCHEIQANRDMGQVRSFSRFAAKVMRNVIQEKAYEMPSISYVYATKSPAFPGLVKIGKTVDVANRLTSLNTSCAPAPHFIVAVAPTFDNDRDERAAHSFFASARREGEFFELDDGHVIAYFNTHIMAQYNVELAQNIARLQGLSVQ